MASDSAQSFLNLTSEEKRAFGQHFKDADTEKLGVVTGDVAVKFFERTKLDPTVLAEIWQIADTENRGFLAPSGFSIALRLIGHCQAGRDPSLQLSKQPGPLPRFDGTAQPAQTQATQDSPRPLSPQASGSVSVPPLTPDKVGEYAGLFDKAGARNGYLGGEAAKQMFERARLPNEALGTIWNLADTQQRGALNLPEFVIAMHLIASMRTGSLRTLPQTLPPGLYEAASRRGSQAAGTSPAVSRQLTGQMPQRTQSPLSRGAFAPPSLSPQSTGDAWVVTAQDKSKFDQIFASIDKSGAGYINGEQAVQFFSTSGLSEDTLASIWDLADMRSEGRLNRDEFAVAMYLIRQQRSKKDDRGNLPATLPPALIPPSMRQRNMPPSQPTAPAFDNAAFAPQMPKSAADDLFGLDALTANDQAGPQDPSVPSSPQRATPFQGPSQGPATSFRPFVPTSSFGQNLATQSTGSSVQQGQPQERGISQVQTSAGGDDLLGDNDPDVNRGINDESAELGNMSNQIGQLRTQMQEVQGKKSATEAQASASSEQRRELETRLAQFRAQYEQEVKDVKALEERLNSSRAETRKLQQEMAMVEGAYQDLQTQHQQVGSALEADEKENASLKERIQQMNTEITKLKPQLDKMRSDARQQKGMVAINKKQLATNENARDKIQNEMSDLERESAERAAPAPPEQPPTNASSAVASPALSVGSQNNNPFFRRPTESGGERAMSPAAFPQPYDGSSGQNTFDSIFGPSEGGATQSTGPPPATTFRSATPPNQLSTPPVTSPSTSTTLESPQTEPPPPPPESRQINSSSLPLRGISNLRADSFSSSVKANAPASRAGGSASATPTRFVSTPAESLASDDGSVPENAVTSDVENQTSSLDVVEPADSRQRSQSGTDTIKPEEKTSEIPGAFPADPPSVRSTDSGNDHPRSLEMGSSAATAAAPAAASEPTASAFPTVMGAGSGNTGSEFPPIQDVQEDDDTSSESEAGFDDDFASAAPASRNVVTTSSNGFSSSAATATASSDAAQVGNESVDANDQREQNLPAAADHVSPPPYNRTTETSEEDRDANQFPREFGGLLPSREIASSPPTAPPQSPPEDLKSPPIPQPATINGTAPQSSATAQVPSANVDEFDSAFDDLTEAKEEDDKFGQDSFTFHSAHQDDYEFNPMFESPAPSNLTTGFEDRMQTPATPTRGVVAPAPTAGATPAATTTTTNMADSFADFQPSTGATASAFSSSQQPSQVQTSGTEVSHDWDEIFSGLDSAPATQSTSDDPFTLGSSKPVTNIATASEAATGPQVGPEVSRTISIGEHDDPILKTLTGMGYPRGDALKALEKYDYNLDMAADYLVRHTRQ